MTTETKTRIQIAVFAFVLGFAVNAALPQHRRVSEQWAADAGHAEYYLDTKTGKTEWRWKACGLPYLTGGSATLTLPDTGKSPYYAMKEYPAQP